jgi:HAD superfamily hydrolase (TIGR01509 family)
MVTLREVRAVVFDLDGVIVNTEELYRDAVIAAAEAAGRQMQLEAYLSTLGLPDADVRLRLKQWYGDDFDSEALLNGASQRFRALLETELRLKLGVVELLDVLDERTLPRAIATSARHEWVARYLKFHGLGNRFDAIIAYGDYSRAKPHPEPFLKAAQRLGVDPAFCLAIEDSAHGARSAIDAGMMTVVVPDLLRPPPDVESSCVMVAETLLEVCKILREVSTK